MAVHQKKRPMMSAYIIGALGYVLGLAFSFVIDSPSGSVMVITLTTIAMITWLLVPNAIGEGDEKYR